MNLRLTKPNSAAFFCAVVVLLVYSYNVYVLVKGDNNIVLARRILIKTLSSPKQGVETCKNSQEKQYFANLIKKQIKESTTDTTSTETAFGSVLNSYD